MNITDIYNNCQKQIGTLKQFIILHKNAFYYTPINENGKIEIAYQINGTFNKNNSYNKICSKYDFFIHITYIDGKIKKICIINHDKYNDTKNIVCLLSENNIPLYLNGKTIKFIH